MDIDHIFIFVDPGGKAADQLAQFGLTEGSSRVHTGQGTTNRKFYFDNFFLEILWVHNEDEINSEPLKETGLTDRARHKENLYSPYGLCLINNEETDILFKNSLRYQPGYFPNGMAIEILKNEELPHLPWTFRLPFRGSKGSNEQEPKIHKNGIKRLTMAQFNFFGGENDDYLSHFRTADNLAFTSASAYGLTLTFDNHNQGKSERFKDLSLVIEY